MELAGKNTTTRGIVLKYEGVICISAIDWDFLKQRVHYIMGGFAEKGMKVLYVENTGVRNPGIKDLSRLRQRFNNSLKATAAGKVPHNIDVFSPLAIPFPFSYPAVLYNERYIKNRIENFLNDQNLSPEEVIFWTYLATPVVLRLAARFSWGRIIYDLVSDPKLVSPTIEPHEKRLLGIADIVLFASYTLCEQYRAITRNPVVFKDGFNHDLLKVDPGSCEIDNLPRPRFLYIGGINDKIWPETLEELARSFPGGSIILMGPKAGDAIIPNMPNIHLLPAREQYNDLAPFLAGADAGIIPYRNNHYSGAMHPAKLNEYLVFGLPVVATATPELKKLCSEWGKGFLYLGEGPVEFSRVAANALAEDSQEYREKRKINTACNAWGNRIDKLLRIIDNTS